MKQADCLRMALAELPQGTMEIVGRPAAEPGVLFTGTFQGETDGRGRMEVYPVFPGVEASFNTVLGTYAAFRHEAARSTLEINHCRLGRVGWDLRDGMSVYLGGGRSVPPQCGLLRGFCDALPGGDVRGADDLRGFDPSGGVAAPHLGGGGLPGREAGGKNSVEAGPSPFRRDRSWRRSSGPCTGSRRCGGYPISG